MFQQNVLYIVSEPPPLRNSTCYSCTRLSFFACTDLAHWTSYRNLNIIFKLSVLQPVISFNEQVLVFVINSCSSVVGFVVLFALYICIKLKLDCIPLHDCLHFITRDQLKMMSAFFKLVWRLKGNREYVVGVSV